jgi:hypothetical protein
VGVDPAPWLRLGGGFGEEVGRGGTVGHLVSLPEAGIWQGRLLTFGIGPGLLECYRIS